MNRSVLSENDEAILSAYLLGKKFPPGTSISVLLNNNSTYKLNLKKFAFFKSRYDLYLKLEISGPYLVFIVGTISGQESKFGLLDLAKKSWAIRNYFPFEEVVSAKIDTHNRIVFVGFYTYRFIQPPIYSLSRIAIEHPNAEVQLARIDEPQKGNEPEALDIDLSEPQYADFHVHGLIYRFSRK